MQASTFGTRREALAANTSPRAASPRELTDGRWCFPAAAGEEVDSADLLSLQASLDKMSKTELQEWAEDLGYSQSGTKAEIKARIQRQ